MIHTYSIVRVATVSLPRTRGDDPYVRPVTASLRLFAPHARG